MKKRPRIFGELIAIFILIMILVWFFVINFNPTEISVNSIITGVLRQVGEKAH